MSGDARSFYGHVGCRWGGGGSGVFEAKLRVLTAVEVVDGPSLQVGL